MPATLPLRKRPIDIVIIGFFLVNLLFVTYIVDFEQLAIPGPVDQVRNNFTYPVWPPAPFVDMVHWWARSFDPVILARPAWWKATIWLDAVLFGPFYLVGLYAFFRGREWIKLPAIVCSSILFTNVVIILSEEIWGVYASPALPIVLLANAPWFIFPFIIIARMASPHPFVAREPAASGALEAMENAE
jgi:hypothetical protein